MSHVTHMNESCHTYEWSHVTHMNESCHTYGQVFLFWLFKKTSTFVGTDVNAFYAVDTISRLLEITGLFCRI